MADQTVDDLVAKQHVQLIQKLRSLENQNNQLTSELVAERYLLVNKYRTILIKLVQGDKFLVLNKLI